MTIQIAIVYGILGFIALWFGGEGLVRSTTHIAKLLRTTVFAVSVTILAAATSGPELFVNIISSFRGSGIIGLGNILGANITNLALIFAIATLFMRRSYKPSDPEAQWAFPAALGINIFLLMLGLDGTLSRFDGGMLLALFIIWLVFAIRGEQFKRLADKLKKTVAFHFEKKHMLASLGVFTLSIAALLGGAELLIRGVQDVSLEMGIPSMLIAATIIAFGTSLPELFTVIFSIIKKQPAMGSGTIFGSVVFNAAAILGITSLIHPLDFPLEPFFTLQCLVLLALLLASPVIFGYAKYSRVSSAALLAVYVFFIVYIIQLL